MEKCACPTEVIIFYFSVGLLIRTSKEGGKDKSNILVPVCVGLAV
jgi:hypothetical protein